MIETRNISKSYKAVQVVKRVSLAFPKGSVTSLIGSNGAGKSTLLSMIANLIKPSNGQVIIDNQSVIDYKSKALAKKIAFLKQQNHINLKITVQELVRFGRFPYSQNRLTKDDEEIVKQAIAFLNLEEIAHKYLDELSGGQQQRAYLAMIVAQDTEYILLDEPLNNLDMRHSVQIMKTLQRLCKEKGRTIIMVIHDINFASRYSDYIAALKAGTVVRFGSTEEIMTPEILKDVFGIDFEIIDHNGHKICNYY